MADADLTYDFSEIPRFVEQLDEGAELVMGDRMDNIQPGAMPWLHRYVGNPVLTGVLNLFFRTGVSDAHCGMRALRRDVLPRLDLRTTGMEFASEMVIRAAKEKLEIGEFPIEYHPRGGESKLSSFRDGWRHLRFLLVHSPTHLFMVPGRDACWRSARSSRWSSLLQIDVFGRAWDIHTMVGGRAADDRRHPGASRSGSAPTRTGPTSWARRTRGSTACARASGSSTGCVLGGAVLALGVVIAGGDRGRLDRPRLRRSSRRSGSPCSPPRWSSSASRSSSPPSCSRSSACAAARRCPRAPQSRRRRCRCCSSRSRSCRRFAA